MAAKFGHCFRELGGGDKAELFARRFVDMVDGRDAQADERVLIDQALTEDLPLRRLKLTVTRSPDATRTDEASSTSHAMGSHYLS
jgi:hypothetical protein